MSRKKRTLAPAASPAPATTAAAATATIAVVASAATATATAAAAEAARARVIARLQSTDPDQLSARAALDLVYELRALLGP